MRLVSRRSAGRSAEAQFGAAREAWRRRVLRRIRLWLYAVLAALFVLEWRWGGHLLDWTLGLAFGALMALGLWVYDSPPKHIEDWRTGAEAERRTAKALRAIERDGWVVAHDLAAGRGNRDHVLVGAAGVFLLDSKHLLGTTSVEGDVVRVERPDNPPASYELRRLAAGARAAAAGLKADLQAPAGGRVWVQAVIVVWGEFPAGVVEGDRVTFVAGEQLTQWLRGQRERITPARRAALASAVRGLPTAEPG
jgi:hypothetical protein